MSKIFLGFLCTAVLSSQSPPDRQVGGFQLSAITDKAALNTHLHVSVWTRFRFSWLQYLWPVYILLEEKLPDVFKVTGPPHTSCSHVRALQLLGLRGSRRRGAHAESQRALTRRHGNPGGEPTRPRARCSTSRVDTSFYNICVDQQAGQRVTVTAG